MKNFARLKIFIEKYFFNPKWRCLSCGKEIFEGEFCDECKEKLPIIGENRCLHCGRKTASRTEYCLACKGKITETDACVSAFSYEKPVSTLIKKLKYYNGRYLADPLSGYVYAAFLKSGITADSITFVPMTERAEKKRKFNQSKLLAEKFSEKSGLRVLDVLVKTKETKRQAKLGGKDRRKNLISAFSVKNRKEVKGKKIAVIDDVTTTGATGEAVAEKLKRAGAAKVYLITVASVPYGQNKKTNKNKFPKGE